jgi:CHAT domain-containing protein
MPRIDEELRSITAVLSDAKVFFGPDATDKTLRQNAADSRLIHIATHWVFREDQPLFSGIRLGDKLLTLFDLYTLKLPGEPCHVERLFYWCGAVASGDELMGLARSLLFVGARSLLLTLWEVNDSTTAGAMRLFYASRAGQDCALALQRAMHQLREHHPHPYYWAPFALIGGVSPNIRAI